MIYLFALLTPPLGLLFAGRVIQAFFNGMLCFGAIAFFFLTLGAGVLISLFIWLVAIAHAVLVVSDTRAKKRNQEMVRAMRASPPRRRASRIASRAAAALEEMDAD